jgi:hypothetical protein
MSNPDLFADIGRSSGISVQIVSEGEVIEPVYPIHVLPNSQAIVLGSGRESSRVHKLGSIAMPLGETVVYLDSTADETDLPHANDSIPISLGNLFEGRGKEFPLRPW